MVIDSHGQITLRIILTDDILIKISLDLFGLRHLPLLKLLLTRFLLLTAEVFLNDTISLCGTIFADIAVDTCYQQRHLLLTPPTEVTRFLHSHYFFLVRTSSIIPYALASSAVIQ